MKQILVPTDFSAHSATAFRYAMAMGHAFGASVTLLHVTRLRAKGTHFSTSIAHIEAMEREAVHTATAQLSQFVREQEPFILQQAPGELKQLVRLGFVEDEVLSLTERGGYDFVVMGARGKTNNPGYRVGTITQAILNNVEVPVLAVPIDALFTGFRHTVFASNLRKVQADELKQVVELAQPNNGRITVLDIESRPGGITHNEMQMASDRLKSIFNYPNLEVRVVISKDLEQGLMEFVQNNEVDLLAVVMRERSVLQRLFQPSLTMKLTLAPVVPFLGLAERNSP